MSCFYFQMVFSDTTTKNGAIQSCETWLFGNNYGAISNSDDMLKTFTREINTGLDETHAEIFKTDGRWQYDDKNFGNLNSATTNLADDQRNYTLDSSQIIIDGVEVLDSAGNYYPLRQIDYRTIRESGQSESEFFGTKGKPIFYDVAGDVVKLYPAPRTADVTTTAGLRVFFKREADYFVYTDTSKEFGIPRTFHDVPILFACARYAKANDMTSKAREIDSLLEKRKLDIKNHFNLRNSERKLRIKPAYRSAK